MKTKTCCLIGFHNLSQETWKSREKDIVCALSDAVSEGCRRVLFRPDQITPALFPHLLEVKERQRPDLFLEAVFSYPAQGRKIEEQFPGLLAACNGVRVVCGQYAPANYIQVFRYMIGQSQKVIAVYAGQPQGETLFAMRYAHTLGREIQAILI